MPELQPLREYDGDEKCFFADKLSRHDIPCQEPAVKCIVCGFQPLCKRCFRTHARAFAAGDMGTCRVCKTYCHVTCGHTPKQAHLRSASNVAADAATAAASAVTGKVVAVGTASKSPGVAEVPTEEAPVQWGSVGAQTGESAPAMPLSVKATGLTASQREYWQYQQTLGQFHMYMKLTCPNCYKDRPLPVARAVGTKHMRSFGDDSVSSGADMWERVPQPKKRRRLQRTPKLATHLRVWQLKHALDESKRRPPNMPPLMRSQPQAAASSQATAATPAAASPVPPHQDPPVQAVTAAAAQRLARQRGLFVGRYGPPPKGTASMPPAPSQQ